MISFECFSLRDSKDLSGEVSLRFWFGNNDPVSFMESVWTSVEVFLAVNGVADGARSVGTVVV